MKLLTGNDLPTGDVIWWTGQRLVAPCRGCARRRDRRRSDRQGGGRRSPGNRCLCHRCDRDRGRPPPRAHQGPHPCAGPDRAARPDAEAGRSGGGELGDMSMHAKARRRGAEASAAQQRSSSTGNWNAAAAPNDRARFSSASPRLSARTPLLPHRAFAPSRGPTLLHAHKREPTFEQPACINTTPTTRRLSTRASRSSAIRSSGASPARLTEDQFKPLRLMNGLYLQLHAYMLRVAIPYGTLDGKQMRMLGHIARKYDRGYGHFTTRQNIQYNWIKLAGRTRHPRRSRHDRDARDPDQRELHPQHLIRPVRRRRRGRGRGSAPLGRTDPAVEHLPPRIQLPAAQVQDRGDRQSDEDRAAMRLHDIGIQLLKRANEKRDSVLGARRSSSVAAWAALR